MAYAEPKGRLLVLRLRLGTFPGAGAVRRARRHGLRLPELPFRASALPHPPDDPHQRADRVAAPRLLRRHLLPPARGGRARDPQHHAWPTCSSSIFVAAAALAVVGYLFRIHEGREFLEQPTPIKLAITAAVLIFLYNVSMTVLKGRKTAVSSVLLLGLWGAGVFFLFAFYNPSNLVARQDLLVVGGPHLGRGRVGADHGSDPRLPPDQGHRRRSRGDREVALRHRRPVLVQRPARHRPSLLAGSARRPTGSGSAPSSALSKSCRSSPWWSGRSTCSGAAAATTRTRPPCCGASAAR